MAELLLTDLADDLKTKLHERAKRHGRTTEAEARTILEEAIKKEAGPEVPLGTRLRALFSDIGLEEDIPEHRGSPARPANFSE